MENKKTKHINDAKKDANDDKDMLLDYEISSCLFGRKDTLNQMQEENNNNNVLTLDEKEESDNTDPNIMFEILKAKPSYKLLCKSFDTLNKKQLSEFKIFKKYNNEETYFYLLEYLVNVKIIKDKKQPKKLIDVEKKNKTKKNKEKNPKLKIEFLNGIVVFQSDIMKKKNKKVVEKTENDYMNIIKNKNINIDDYFIMNENITIENLREKMQKFYKKKTMNDDKKNSIPEFESELFFHYQLKNVFKTFKELSDVKFQKKIEMISVLFDFINKVKTKKIKDRIILAYFYFIIDVEYDIDLSVMLLMQNYEENNNISYKNAYVNKNENRLYINNSDIVIDNFDNYILNQNHINNIVNGKIKLPLQKSFFSFKGFILQREFTSKDGNVIYEKFIGSNLVKDLLSIIYGKNIKVLTSIFAIKLIENNTYYFPINNSTYGAYTDKKCFKVYIDFGINEFASFKNIELNNLFKHMIRKAFMIVNIQHEYGHISKPLLSYIYPELNLYDSPNVEIKKSKNKSITIKEGGELIEYLLYDRKIYELNIKEVIYICNLKNYSKSLLDFRNDFLNLKNESVLEVFQRESKDNPELIKMFEEYMNLSEDTKIQLETQIFKSAKRYDDISILDLENYYFESGKIYKPHNKFREDSDSDSN